MHRSTISIFLAATSVICASVTDEKYYCSDDAYCAAQFPGTVCIAVRQYGRVIRKCTPNTQSRPACRDNQPGLCPAYQSPEYGFLNAHCIFVEVQQENPEESLPSSRSLITSETNTSKAAPAKEEPESYAVVTFGKTKVTGVFKCVDASECASKAYDPSTCDSEACGQTSVSTLVCSNHGTCTYPSILKMKARSCACFAGFGGAECEKTISGACDVDCGPGGDCVNGECKCKAGYDGKSYKGKQGVPDPRCEKCTSDLGCQNGQPCDVDTGECVCNEGYNGVSCGTIEDSCTKKDCGVGSCQVLDDDKAACYCPICTPECLPCKTNSCSDCESLAIRHFLPSYSILAVVFFFHVMFGS